MSRAAIGSTVAAVVLGLVVVVAALGSTSTEVSVAPSVTIGSPAELEPTTAVVITTRSSGGVSIFGVRFGSRTYTATVQFYETPGCHDTLEYEAPWPPSSGSCAEVVPVEGEIVGLGITGTGESIVGVDVDITADCFAVLTPGQLWPPTHAACAGAAGSQP